MFFSFCGHHDIVRCDIFGCCLISIDYQWVCNFIREALYQKYHEGTVTLIHKENVITGLDVVAAWLENFILWSKDLTLEWESWKLRYLPNFWGFGYTNPIRTPLKTCMFIPAPVKQKDMIIKQSFKSNSSRSNGLPCLCPIFKVMFSFFAFFFFFIFPYFFSHRQTVLSFKLGNLGLNFLMAALVPHWAAYFATSCLSFSS